MRAWLEYCAAWLMLKALGLLPRGMARAAGAAITTAAFYFRAPLRRAADFNLRMAFPSWTGEERKRTIRNMLRHVGWMAGEFSQFPKYTSKNIGDIVVLDGNENYLEALRRWKGILFLTGHIGAWELSSFAHALYGYPCHFLVRPLENSRVDALVNRYRSLSGCSVIEKNGSARAILKSLRNGQAVGILADHNTSLDEGVFVDFFGVPACTTAGLARFALRTDAAVVPGYALWDEALGKYRLRFEPALELIRTGDEEADIRANTARFMQVIETCARAHPDQWLWVHKRWKTRPPGEKPLYPF